MQPASKRPTLVTPLPVRSLESRGGRRETRFVEIKGRDVVVETKRRKTVVPVA